MYEKLAEVLRELEGRQDELNMMNEQLQHLVFTDALTGLANRRYFDEKLQECIGVGHFSLVMFDIDHFKKVNDKFGHQIGDFVLQELSIKATSYSDEKGYVARIGGEEFAMLLPEMTAKEAVARTETFRLKVEKGAWIHTPITISMGVTEVKENDTVQSIVKRADDALYASKENGRNRVTLSNVQ